MDVNKLIRLIELHPVIYDVTRKDYSDRYIREITWNKIATELNQTVRECMRKWKSLRDQTLREKKAYMHEGNGSSLKRKEWLHWKALNFLLPHLSSRETHKFICEAPEDHETQSIKDSPHSSLLSPPESPLHLSVPELVIAPSRKRKAEPMQEMGNISLSNEVLEHDPDVLFLLSMIPLLKRLPTEKKEEAKLAVHSTLFNFVTTVPSYSQKLSFSHNY